MRPPKLLPWIARRAGISDELALKLWRRAAGEAEERIGNAVSSEYFAAAVDGFLRLVEDEACGEGADKPASLGWVWRYQKRMATHSLTTSYSLFRVWDNLRRRLGSPKCPV